MRYYIDGVVIILIVWLLVGAWRLRRRRTTPGAAAAGMMYELLSDDRRAAIEVIAEERTGYRDPEDRDGNLPELSNHEEPVNRDTAAERAITPTHAYRSSVERKGAVKMLMKTSWSFRRGMIAGVMALAVVCGLGALLADASASVPAYIRFTGIANVIMGVAGLSIVYWWERRSSRLTAHS